MTYDHLFAKSHHTSLQVCSDVSWVQGDRYDARVTKAASKLARINYSPELALRVEAFRAELTPFGAVFESIKRDIV